MADQILIPSGLENDLIVENSAYISNLLITESGVEGTESTVSAPLDNG